jgi:hypothetical protein
MIIDEPMQAIRSYAVGDFDKWGCGRKLIELMIFIFLVFGRHK